MQLQELQAQAAKVIELKPNEEGFELISFTTKSGGVPKNKAGIEIARSSEDQDYYTRGCGWAYKGEAVIECKKTGAKDALQREVYVCPDEKVFVYDYTAGGPQWFDRGAFKEPIFK